MKTESKQGSKNPLELIQADRAAQKTLKHILSPIERAALKNNFQSFTYRLDRITVHVNPLDCTRLMTQTFVKVEWFSDLVTRSHRQTLGNSARHRKFLKGEVKSQQLPEYLKNRLLSNNC